MPALLSRLQHLAQTFKMPPARSAEYSPVRCSLSADEASQSFLHHDEKPFLSRQPPTRRYPLALKALFAILLLTLHAGLVLLLASWLASLIVKIHAAPDHSSGGGEVLWQSDDTHTRYTFDGVVPAVYKDPDAEFLMKDPCGTTPAEARARGCRYGMLYGAWLPEACYDEETEGRFKRYTQWRFYLGPNRTDEKSWDEVAKGEFEYVLVEWEYHQRHCAEMNRRLFTAMSRRGLHSIDSYLSQWAHTDHCAHSVMEVRPRHELNAILWRKFPDCGVVRWKNEL